MEDTGDGLHKRGKQRRARVEMDFVPRAQGFGYPHVAFFPSGFDPLRSSRGDDESSPSVEFHSYRNSKPKSRQHELVAHGAGKVDFVGSNFAGEAASWQPCDYLLGVFNKAEGSLKLLPLEGDKMLRMEPVVRGLEYGRAIDKEVQEEEEVGDKREADRAKRKHLLEAFGSKKSKMKQKRSERSRVKEDDLGDIKDMENLFQEAVANGASAPLTTERVMEEANSRIRNVPPHDPSATTPENAYVLNEIIRPDEWEALANDVELLEKAASGTSSDQSNDKEGTSPKFVQDRLNLVKVKDDTEGNQRRAHILVYVRHLLAFHLAADVVVRKAADPWNASTASNAHDLTETLGIPAPIVAKFLEIFTSKGKGSVKASNGCERRPEHRNLTISYVLILGMMLDKFEADPYDLAIELKLTVSQVKPHYENLGCKVTSVKASERKPSVEQALRAGKSKWKVTLPMPLKFPKIAPSGRRKY